MLSGQKLFEMDLKDINMKNIQELITNKISEDDYLEYKTPSSNNQELKFNNKEKFKMLKEIAGFATNDGGILIYGINEDKNRVPIEISGIEIVNNTDELQSQITSIITDNLDPILKPNCTIKLLNISNKKYILLLKVFKGLNGPYRILLDKKDYYIRRGNKTEPMDSSEIKQHVIIDSGESERLLNQNPQPLLKLHAKLSKICYARYNIVDMFKKVRKSDEAKCYNCIVNSREELFNYLYTLIRDINEFYYIPSDLKDSINQYVECCEKEYEKYREKSEKIHYKPYEDVTFEDADKIFYLTEKYTKSKIKKHKNDSIIEEFH